MGPPKVIFMPPPQMREPLGSERAGSCITRAPQPALWFARFCQVQDKCPQGLGGYCARATVG